MGAEHRTTEFPEHKRARRGMSNRTLIIVAASVLGAVGLTLLVDATHSEKATGPAVVTVQGQPILPQPVSQEGTLISVSANSLTARSANGYTQTYLVTSDTLAITNGGSEPFGVAPRFAVNDEVNIVGTMRNGTVLVTAVAHRDLGHGDARPMDFVDG
jgi:hypothetical protein